MEHEEIERVFCWKISAELKRFKYCMMQKQKEGIYASAYQIDCMVRIYEILAEQSHNIRSEILQNCMETSNLLEFLYGEWLKVPDSQGEELETVIRQVLQESQTRTA